jgi:hypothetical protein
MIAKTRWGGGNFSIKMQSDYADDSELSEKISSLRTVKKTNFLVLS